MRVYKEIKKIAKCVGKIHSLAEKLEDKIDTEGIDWFTAEFVTLNEHQKKRLKFVDCDYFCEQRKIDEDWYCGELYFKTDVPGQYVRVHFDY